MIIEIILGILGCMSFWVLGYKIGKKVTYNYFRKQRRIIRTSELVYRFLFIENIEDLAFLSDLEYSKLSKYSDLKKEKLIRNHVYLIKDDQEIGWMKKGDWLLDMDPLSRVPDKKNITEQAMGLTSKPKSEVPVINMSKAKKNKERKKKNGK